MTRANLIATTAIAAVLAVAGKAVALPQSPTIVGTNGPGPGASFSSSASSLTVTQTNSRVVIDWAGFNIASGETVTFAQPSNTAIALNRVTTNALTTIDGALNANGGVWIFSPGGMLIGNGAAINVGSFLASTAIADNTTVNDFICGCGGSIPFQPQPLPANPSLTVQSGATIDANAGFVELNSPTIVQDGTVTASDSVDYTALPGGEIDFSEESSGLKLKEFAGTPLPAQNQATSITSTGNTTAGGWVGFVTFNDPALGAPVSSVINLSGHVAANGLIADNTTGTAYGVLLVTDAPAQNADFQIPASSPTQINASGSVITAAAGRIGAEAGTITTGNWTTANDLGGSGLNIEAGSGGLNVPGTLDFSGASEATLTSLGPVTITGAINNGDANGLSITGSSIAISGAISMSHGFLSVSTPGSLSISGAINPDQEGASFTESGSSAVTLSGSFGAGGDLGQNVSLTFTGTPDSGQSLTIGGTPYDLIFTQAELLNINTNLAGHYALAAPLDLTGTIFGGSPIASLVSTPFTGTFTGLGNTISNLAINDLTPLAQVGPQGYATNGVVGLFGAVGPSGMVEDVALANANVSGGDGESVGALVGGLSGAVRDSSSSGSITTGNHTSLTAGTAYAVAGGLVGASNGAIINSRSSATVTGGDAEVGGLVGSSYGGGSISDSSASGDVHVGDNLAGNPSVPIGGGLVGIIYGYQFGGVNPLPTPVSGSFATGAVFGGAGAAVGGFVGDVIQGQVTTSYATGSVTQSAGGQNGQDSLAGGFVGFVGVGGSVTQSWADAPVSTVGSSGAPIVGGVGNYFTFAGGFVGDMQGQGAVVSDSYALGSVTSTGTANAVLGGFAGTVFESASIDHVYATGLVSGPGILAGLVGILGDTIFTDTSGSISDSYWDQGTTGQAVGANAIGTGTPTNLIAVGGVGPNPYLPATYANFDLTNTWFMLPGGTRPMLRSEYSTTITNAHQLQLMAMNLAANYTLANNIDMSETTSASGVWNPADGFVPVGSSEASAFAGSLDGAGHTISNLTIIDTTAVNQTVFGGFAKNGFAGLFGLVGPTGLVENLQIDNANVTGGDGMDAGVLAGAIEGVVFNVATSGSVTVGNDVNTPLGGATAAGGGLAGAFGGLAINTSSSANVTGGDAAVGGLIGVTVADASLPTGHIFFSHASGNVAVGAAQAGQAAPFAGGLVGIEYGVEFDGVTTKPFDIALSYATGAVTGGGGSFIGGFAGVVDAGSISGSYATGSVTQTAGGQNGQNSIAGGFVGAMVNNSIVDKSWAGGSVTTVGGPANNLFSFAGGFVGDVDVNSTIEKDYSLGSVTATGSAFSSVGGFLALIQGGSSADQTYATGLVTGSGGFVGGLAGIVNPNGTLTNSYWDEGTTGQTNAVGGGAGTVSGVGGVGGSTGLSPYQASSYPAFSFGSGPGDNNWVIAPGETRPILATEFSTTITDAHQLELMNLDLSGNYTLAGNIDASETTNPAGVFNPANGFVPVGGNGLPAFTGTFNGDGYTISNLTIIDTTAVPQHSGVNTLGFAGLFGYANGATLENVDIANANITVGDGMRAGALVAILIGGSVTDASSSGTVTLGSATVNGGTGFVASGGGLIGFTSGSILDSHSSATVTSTGGYAGGLVGAFAGPSIVDSYATGAVSTGGFNGAVPGAGPLAGGLAGLIRGSGTVTGSYATGPVSGGGGGFIGGFAGAIEGTVTVTDSYATGSVTQTAGGQNGQNDLEGGFVGVLLGSATVSHSFASGPVTGVGGSAGLVSNIGGFAGDNEGVVTDTYATGAVASSGSSFSLVGGFAGVVDSGGSVNHVYATGLVSGTGTLEGLVGQIGNATQPVTSGSVSNSYWDEGTTGQTTGFTLSGTGSATNVTGIGGTTGIDPFAQATYAGWDFNNTWSTPSAGFYPELFGASHVLQFTGGATSFTYGGYTAVTYTLVGLQGGDTTSVLDPLTATINGATTSTSGYYNAGGYGVTFSGATATGASGPYRILYSPGTLTVTPRALTGSLVGTVQKTYDGTTAATLAAGNYQLSGVIAGDSVALNDPTSGTYASKDAGSGIGVNVSGLALTGADALDYTVNGSAAGAVGVIDPKAITATLTGTVVKTYDGTTSASLAAGNYQLSGVIAGDSVSLNDPTSGAYASKDVGSGIDVGVSGLALTGANAGDYTVNATTSAAIGVIDPKALTVSLTGVEKTYDGTTSATLTASNYQLNGVVAGDSVSLNDPSAGTYASKDAGSGIDVSVSGLVLSGANASDYTVTSSISDAVGVIDPKALTVTLTGTVEKTYDGTTSATLTTSDYQLSGVLAGDTVALNDPTGGTYASKDAGSGIGVSVSGLALTGADARDYSVSGSASDPIGVIDPKAITATLVGSVVKPFDGTTSAPLAAANYQLSGVVAGDSVSLNDPTSGVYANTGPGTGIPVTADGLALTGADAGDYTVNSSASAPIGTINSTSSSVIQVQVVTAPTSSALTSLTSPDSGQSGGGQTSGDSGGAPSPSGQASGGQTSGDLTSGAAATSAETSPLDNEAVAAGATDYQLPPDQPAGGIDTSGVTSAGDQTGGGQVANGPSGGQGASVGEAGAPNTAPPPAAGASDTAADDETAPAPGASGKTSVFPVARSATNQGRAVAGDNSGVTGAGNDDLWKGADLGGGTSP